MDVLTQRTCQDCQGTGSYTAAGDCRTCEGSGAVAKEAGFCGAVSQHGTPVTAYVHGAAVLAIARPGRDFVCTQDSRHKGSHAACDGNGHILARWPRKAAEVYWQSGDCGEHGHG